MIGVWIADESIYETGSGGFYILAYNKSGEYCARILCFCDDYAAQVVRLIKLTGEIPDNGDVTIEREQWQ